MSTITTAFVTNGAKLRWSPFRRRIIAARGSSDGR